LDVFLFFLAAAYCLKNTNKMSLPMGCHLGSQHVFKNLVIRLARMSFVRLATRAVCLLSDLAHSSQSARRLLSIMLAVIAANTSPMALSACVAAAAG